MTSSIIPDDRDDPGSREIVTIVLSDVELVDAGPSVIVVEYDEGPGVAGGRFRTAVPRASSHVSMKTTSPSGGPVRPGDVWADTADTPWFAVDYGVTVGGLAALFGPGGLLLVSPAGVRRKWQSVHNGPAGPIRLLRRHGSGAGAEGSPAPVSIPGGSAGVAPAEVPDALTADAAGAALEGEAAPAYGPGAPGGRRCQHCCSTVWPHPSGTGWVDEAGWAVCGKDRPHEVPEALS